ncbi:MAG TPA: glycoside hydrolase family 125 protein [Edaphobacter sp.]|nr:glycoside hydrolase family 125 protein [Edaphobacter sp.]
MNSETSQSAQLVPSATNKPLTAITRRELLRGSSALCLFTAMSPRVSFAFQTAPVLTKRPPLDQRRFTSAAVERALQQTSKLIADPQLAAIFQNCLPNTLDTTVTIGTFNDKPDTFVVTGDIDAMWLRDSSAQVMPYVALCKDDKPLAALIEGVIRRHARQILLDPYANAFLRNPTDPPLSWSVHDQTDMRPGIGERKWEIDSLCHPIRLAHAYWRTTGDASPFDETWHKAAWQILRTFKEQQRKSDHGPYHFQRSSPVPTDTLMLSGYGNPIRPNGLICSMFRPSDDACTYSFFIPANLFAVTTLHRLSEMSRALFSDTDLATQCDQLANEVDQAIQRHAIVTHPIHGKIYAYEIDGFGNTLCMDDANAPSLLSLPYLESVTQQNPIYQSTRRFALSPDNPYFFRGSAAEGIGGPHIGLNYIWPMSIIVRALTSTSDQEIAHCLRWLRNTTGNTLFMHEAFQKDNPTDFTRAWFAWANTLFGELILKVAAEKPHLLATTYKENS